MRAGQQFKPKFKTHVDCRLTHPRRIPAICFVSKAEREVATLVYIRHVVFDIQHTPEFLHKFLSGLSPYGTGFQAIRNLRITCSSYSIFTFRKDRPSKIHIELLNACSSLNTLNFIMCIPVWHPAHLSRDYLMNFYEVEKLFNNKALKKIIFDLPTSHQRGKASFLGFAQWLVNEFNSRNRQHIDVIVEWHRRG